MAAILLLPLPYTGESLFRELVVNVQDKNTFMVVVVGAPEQGLMVRQASSKYFLII
jgi:hypothetical protein